MNMKRGTLTSKNLGNSPFDDQLGELLEEIANISGIYIQNMNHQTNLINDKLATYLNIPYWVIVAFVANKISI